MTMKFDRQLDTQSDLIFMEWKLMKDGRMCLIVFEPLAGPSSLKSWMFSETDVDRVKFHQNNDFSPEMIADIKALGETQKPTVVPMRKRQTRFEDRLAPPPKAYTTRAKSNAK